MKQLTVEQIHLAVKRLDRYMKARGESQQSIEAKAGISQSTVSRILNGVQIPSIETLTKILDAIGVPPDEILDDPDALPSRLVGYFATPLTAVASNPVADTELRRVVREIITLTEDPQFTDRPFTIYWPGHHTHPKDNPTIPDRQVYLTDRAHASAHDFLILFCAEPSFGVGQENEIAAQAGLPAIRLIPERISRMMTGSYLRAVDIRFSGSLVTRIHFDKSEFLNALRQMRKLHVASRAFYKGVNNNRFRERLRQLMTSMDTSIRELAENLGISPDYVQAMCDEHVVISNPSLHLLRRIARQFDVSIGFLVGDDDHFQPLWVRETKDSWFRWLKQAPQVDGAVAVQMYEDWRAEVTQYQQLSDDPTMTSHRMGMPGRS